MEPGRKRKEKLFWLQASSESDIDYGLIREIETTNSSGDGDRMHG
jgi:hypothetical protein